MWKNTGEFKYPPHYDSKKDALVKLPNITVYYLTFESSMPCKIQIQVNQNPEF